MLLGSREGTRISRGCQLLARTLMPQSHSQENVLRGGTGLGLGQVERTDGFRGDIPEPTHGHGHGVHPGNGPEWGEVHWAGSGAQEGGEGGGPLPPNPLPACQPRYLCAPGAARHRWLHLHKACRTAPAALGGHWHYYCVLPSSASHRTVIGPPGRLGGGTGHSGHRGHGGLGSRGLGRSQPDWAQPCV